MNRGPTSSSPITVRAIAIRVRLRRVSFGILAAGRIPTSYAPCSFVLGVSTVRTPSDVPLASAARRFPAGGDGVQRVHCPTEVVDLHQLQAGYLFGVCLVAVLGGHQKHRRAGITGRAHLVQ